MTNYLYASKEQKAKRKERMLFLRNTLGWTKQQIADEFGITRERVRQIIGNDGWIAVPDRMFVNRKRKAKAKHEKVYTEDIAPNDLPSMSTREISDLTGLSYQYVSSHRKLRRHRTTSALINAGMAGEEQALAELNKHGISGKLMPNRHPYDILLDDGKTVEVKFRFAPSRKFNSGSDFYFCVLRKREKEFVPDFYLLCIAGDYFVIPSKDAPKSGALGFCWPTGRRTTWQKFHNRFDLIAGGAS